MRFLWILLLSLVFCASALACSSDCSQCHTVPKDREHAVLSTCASCHREHPEKAFEGRCGADCFDCHDYKKVMEISPAHKVLIRCAECHKALKEKSIPLPLKELLGGE